MTEDALDEDEDWMTTLGDLDALGCGCGVEHDSDGPSVVVRRGCPEHDGGVA